MYLYSVVLKENIYMKMTMKSLSLQLLYFTLQARKMMYLDSTRGQVSKHRGGKDMQCSQ